MITITADTSSLKTAGQTLRALPDQMRKVLGLARRDTIKTLKGFVAKAAAEENYITQGEVKKTITLEPSGLRVRSGMLPLDKYKVTPRSPGRRRYTVMGAVKRGGLKPLGSNAFLKRSGGKWRAYVRTTRHRKPVKLLYGPSTAQLAGRESIMERTEQRAYELYESRARYWADRLLNTSG